MKGRDFDEDSRKGSQPKLPNINNVPKYDSPFAIPDDAEVRDQICRYFEWRRKKKRGRDSKNRGIRTWKFGRRGLKNRVLLFGSSMTWVRRVKNRIVINLKLVFLKLLKMQSKIGLRSISLCMILLVKRGKLCCSRCWLIIKGKKSISFKSWLNYIKKDLRELSLCWRRIWRILIHTLLKIKKMLEMQSKKQKFRPERKIRRWQLSRKNLRYRRIWLEKICQRKIPCKVWRNTKISLKV